VAGALFEKGFLAVDDLTRNCEYRFLSLVNRANDGSTISDLIT
jgi:hypothetical protein